MCIAKLSDKPLVNVDQRRWKVLRAAHNYSRPDRPRFVSLFNEFNWSNRWMRAELKHLDDSKAGFHCYTSLAEAEIMLKAALQSGKLAFIVELKVDGFLQSGVTADIGGGHYRRTENRPCETWKWARITSVVVPNVNANGIRSGGVTRHGIADGRKRLKKVFF